MSSSASGTGAGGPDSFAASLGACIIEERSLSVLFLLDESGSLRQTDPGAERVVAARLALGLLNVLTEARESFDPIDINIAVAGFGSDYSPSPGGFRRLTPGSLFTLQQELEAFSERDSDRDTDYVAALLGAEEALRDREGCRLLLWFTDGRYDIATTSPRPVYDERFETAPPPGQRPRAYEDEGRQWLCEPGGVADRLRAASIHVLTGALSFEPASERLFTQRITQGRDDDGTTCGDRWQEANSLGEFVLAEEARDLIFSLIRFVQGGGPVRAGNHPFTLTYGMTQVFIVVSTRTTDFEVALVSPEVEDPTVIDIAARPFDLGSVEVRPEVHSPTVFVLGLRLDQEDTGWVGDWLLTFDPQEEGLSKILFFGDLVVTPLETQIAAEPGEPVTVRYRVEDRRGALPGPADVATLTASAVVVATDGRAVIPGVWDPAGTFTVAFAAPQQPGSITVIPTVTIAVPGTSVLLPFDGTPATVTIAVATTTTTLLPPDGPTIETERFELPSITGGGRTTREGAIRVTAGDDDGCVLLARIAITDMPEGLTAPVVAVTYDGEALADHDASCAVLIARGGPGVVPAEQRLGIDVSAEFVDAVRGVVAGEIELVLVGATDEVRRDGTVAFSVRVSPERSSTALGLWFVALSAVGLGVSGWVGWRLARMRSRRPFTPPPNHLGIAVEKATVTVYRLSDIEIQGEVTLRSDFEANPPQYVTLGGAGTDRRVTVPAGSDYSIPADLVIEGPPGLFGRSHAIASSLGYHVVTVHGGDELPFDLEGSWVFIAESVEAESETSGVCTGFLVLLADDRYLEGAPGLDHVTLREVLLLGAAGRVAKEWEERTITPREEPTPQETATQFDQGIDDRY